MQYKEIIITAPEIYGKKLSTILQKNHFKIIEFPTIETILYDNPEFQKFFNRIFDFDYIILPSRNAINSFIYHAEKFSVTKKTLQNLKYAVIGKDDEYLNRFGLQNSLKTDEASTKGIFEALKKLKTIKKTVVVTPKIKIINEPNIIPDFIKNLQSISSVYRIDGYIIQPVKNPNRNILQKIINSNYDLIALTSGAESEALKYLLNEKIKTSHIKLACFGPYTASAAKKTGFKPKITGNKFNSFENFSEILKSYFKN